MKGYYERKGHNGDLTKVGIKNPLNFKSIFLLPD